MTFTLTFAGVVQTHMQRVVGGYSFMDIQEQLALFFWMRLGAGVVVVIGAALFLYRSSARCASSSPPATSAAAPS